MAIQTLPVMVLVSVHALQKPTMIVNLTIILIVLQTFSLSTHHTLALAQNGSTEKEILVTQQLSYPEARKLIESRTPSVRVSYSSLFNQQSKSVTHQHPD